VIEVHTTPNTRVLRDADGRQHNAAWRTAPDGTVEVWLDGRIHRIASRAPQRAGATSKTGNPDALVSSMPGTIVQVRVAVGDAVTAGQTLILMESMKMELALEAPRDGVVKSVDCSVGQLVEMNATLLRL
jgi:biotin carboxyl carrier protein